MEFDSYAEITHQALKVGMILSAPMLIGALVVGIIVSLFQAVTQINEQTLTFIPKIIVVVAALVFLGPWMSDSITTFTKDLILQIPKIIAEK